MFQYFTDIIESEKNGSKINVCQENRCCTSSNVVSTDELRKAFDAERKEYERKLEKLIKAQLDPLIHGKRSNDLEVALSKLRAERDEYLYEINCLKKQHNTEVMIKLKIIINTFHVFTFTELFFRC